jgi:predicted Zn finger-like uncharacterized protein
MMLTRCPNCGTTFRVTPEQLRIRHGQVRCGSCFATFNALAALSEELPVAGSSPAGIEPEVPASTWAPESDEAPTVHEMPPLADEAATPVEEPPVDYGAELVEIELPQAPQPESATEPTVEVIEIELPPEPLRETGEPVVAPEERQPGVTSPPELEPGAAWGYEPFLATTPETLPERKVEPVAESMPDSTPEVVLEVVPEFAAEPVPRSPLYEQAVRKQRSWPSLLGAMLAVAALLAQAALHFRTELAVRLPETRPALEAACEQLGCEIALPSRIDLLEIEHSDLVPDEKRSGHLLLSATLRNRAAHAQTWPHLELTLTDTSDRALIRRALAPKDYLSSASAIAAGFPARGDQHVQLELKATDVPAVGYRLYLFYP